MPGLQAIYRNLTEFVEHSLGMIRGKDSFRNDVLPRLMGGEVAKRLKERLSMGELHLLAVAINENVMICESNGGVLAERLLFEYGFTSFNMI